VRGFNFKDKKIPIIFRDEALCEMFGWDLYILYKQPIKRIREFTILIDERKKMEKEEQDRAKREANRR